MFDSAIELLSGTNMYSISLLVAVCLFLLTFMSDQLKKGVLTPLKAFAIIWVIFFGYHVYTGNNLYTAMTTPSKEQMEAKKYKKVMIDGREVLYNKDTGEVVKKKKK